jgi:hypothetical protein
MHSVLINNIGKFLPGEPIANDRLGMCCAGIGSLKYAAAQIE